MSDPIGADPPIDTGATNPSRPHQVDIPLSALIVLGVLVVGTILLLRAIDRLQQLIGLAVFAAILSALLAPLLTRARKVLGRVGAAVTIHVLALLLIASLTGVVIQQIRAESESLVAFTDEQIDEVEGWSNQFLERTRLDERLGEAASSWGTTAIIGDDDISAVTTRLSELVIVIVLSIFFTLQGSTIVDMVLRWTDDRRRRRRLRAMWSAATDAGAVYLRRTVVVALASGLAAAGIAAAFDLPAVLLIGAWAALLSAVPLLGTLFGWSPLVVMAFVESSPSTIVAVTVLALVGVAAINAARRRFVSAPCPPGSFLVAMGIATGLTAAGLPGAAAGIFAVVAVVTVLSGAAEDHSSDAAGSDELRAASTGDATDQTTFTSPALDELTTGHDAVIDDGMDEGVDGGRLVLVLSRRTALRITAFVIIAFVVQLAITRVGPILVWATVGALIAVGLDRPVSWAQRRWKLRRSLIVITSSIIATMVVGVLIYTATGSFDEARPMDEGIPEFVSFLEGLPLVGDRVAEVDLAEEIDDFQRDAPRIVTTSPLAGRAVGLVGGGVIGAFWVALATLTCLLDGPRLVSAIDRRVPARLRRQSERLARAGQVALGGYIAGAAVVAALNGGIVALLGLAFGVPLVALLALWAFSWNFIPQIGAVIGWAPLLILAFLESPLRGALGLAIFLVYQIVENNAIQPTIVGHAVDISALAALGAALVGATIAGLIGAALAIPIAGVARALYVETQRDDFPPIRGRVAAHEPPTLP